MNSSPALKIIFMGTPDFAVPSLQLLAQSHHHIEAVVTVPDKPQGRGLRVRASAVKTAAEDLNLTILQPDDLKSSQFIQDLQSYKPDIIIVVAFQILPESVYTIPKFGSFNLHASLLPKYRGAAPIHWALLNGDKETGVTTFFLKRRVDTGNVISQKKIAIESVDNLETLYTKLCGVGAELVLETVDLIAAGDIDEFEQDNSIATPAPKVTTETQLLNFVENNTQCHNRVRAFCPRPGAFTFRDGIRLKILSSDLSDMKGEPGEVVSVSTDSFAVACGQGSLIIHRVQPESKKAMDVASYLRGNPLQVGDHFGK
jgi:methionyl-tRNA formyltransferase